MAGTGKTEKLNNHFFGAIIDGFDDWLEEKGIKIPNDERDEDGSEHNSNIWGDDYDFLMSMIRDVCYTHGIEVEDAWW